MVIFLFMSIKGFINIIKSNVIELLNANKKQEKMPKINFKVYLIALLSLIREGVNGIKLCPDCTEGLENRISAFASKCESLQELIKETITISHYVST